MLLRFIYVKYVFFFFLFFLDKWTSLVQFVMQDTDNAFINTDIPKL